MASISLPAKNMLAAPFNIKVTTTTLTSSSSSSSLLFVFPFSNQHNKRSSGCSKLRMSSSTSLSSSISTANTVSDDQLPQSDTDTNTSWLEFSSNVSGEWDGHGADFTNLGLPVELPEMVVPDAYREWEVRVFDWQTQCPTLAQSHSHHLGLFYKLIKLLPTVGCEADAATRYTVHQMNVGGPDSQVSAFAYHSSGSYVALWPSSSSSTNTFQLEHCLVDPRNKESRVRVIQAVAAANKDSSRLVLTNIQVFREQWYGPFRNGDQLGGCAIRDSAFAITQPLDPSQLAGPWRSSNAIARFQNPPCTDLIQQLVDDSSKQSFTREDDRSNIVFLPKQLWCSVKQTEDGETHCEVGWLFEQGQAITSRCVFSDETNKLKEVKVGLESAVLEDL